MEIIIRISIKNHCTVTVLLVLVRYGTTTTTVRYDVEADVDAIVGVVVADDDAD